MHIDFKVTAWERIELDNLSKEQQNKLVDKIKKGKVTSIQGIYDEYPDVEFDWEVISEANEELTAEENGGQSTIEVYAEDTANPLWTNEIKK